MSNWTKLPGLPSKANPCACCPPIPAVASLDKIIAVGFGAAYVSKDGEQVLDGEASWQDQGSGGATFQTAEDMAKLDPDHDWRVTLWGPLHGESFQRQGEGQWVLVESNPGFA